MNRPPVLDKKDFVRRYAAGEFGNAAPTWNGFLDWSLANASKPRETFYHIRNRIKGGKTWYNVSDSDVARLWVDAVESEGIGNLYISEMAPTERTLIQGEVMLGVHGLRLFYSRVKKPMREALHGSAEEVEGLVASNLLKRYLCPKSWEWLNYLLEAYPDHVIEFSTYSKSWGTLPGYNTVFWEVRNY